jgi:hypothetical protein
MVVRHKAATETPSYEYSVLTIHEKTRDRASFIGSLHSNVMRT